MGSIVPCQTVKKKMEKKIQQQLFTCCYGVAADLDDVKEINIPLVAVHRQSTQLWRLPDKPSQNMHNKAEQQLRGKY